MGGLNDDDHSQYLNETRHDALDADNPHSVTFTQAVTADGGTDISAAEAETLTDGSNADALHEHDTTLLRDPVTDFYDPTGGLPVGPSDGDRYISEATANGWTIDYIYTWDDDAGVWIEEEPDEGWMLWVLLEFMLYFFFSGGWVEADSKVGIDADATPGYLGAANNDGVLRTSAPLTYTDGGDFITLGMTLTTNRYTTTQTIPATDDVSFCNTDGSSWTATLTAGTAAQTHRIINTGSSGNTLTVAPDGTEHLIGANSSITLEDSEAIELTYSEVDGWY